MGPLRYLHPIRVGPTVFYITPAIIMLRSILSASPPEVRPTCALASWMSRTTLLAASLLVGCGGTAAQQALPLGTPRLEEQVSGTTRLLIGVSIVDSSVVWASGQGGTWVRTENGGRSWTSGVVADAATLEFRDVHAASANRAWLLAAGTGDKSRIYHTEDGGRTWTHQWTNDEADGFYDCMDFWDERRGFVYGDAVGGSLRVLVTSDGGATWRRVPNDALPPALQGEGGFAASGTCAIARPGGRGWVATGAGPRPRVLITTDYGAHWTAVDAAGVESGEGAGLTSISMVDDRVGTGFGGNLSVTNRQTENVARTEDGGRTWRALPHVAMNGPVYGGAHIPQTGGRALVAVGPGGANMSLDGAETWSSLDTRAWWGIGAKGVDAVWITGPMGRIARVRLR